MIDRRGFIQHIAIGAIAGALVAMPLAALAQQPGRVWQIGYLAVGPRPADGAPLASLRKVLMDLGYSEGKNISYVGRWAEAQRQLLPGLATELVDQKVDLIITFGSPAAAAARQASSTVPIVMAISGHPVGVGLIESLARPAETSPE
jgi:putative ABC transport system substrate-binding protein